MAQSDERNQYVLLPKRGLRADDPASRSLLREMPHVRSTEPAASTYLSIADEEITVLDSTAEDGPKLVALSDAAAARANADDSPVRAEPITFYQRPSRLKVSRHAAPSAVVTVTIECVDATSGTALADLDVYAFDSVTAGTGDYGRTDALGRVDLTLAPGPVEQILVPGVAGYWGAYQTNVTIAGAHLIRIEPVDLTYVDAVRHYYGSSGFSLATGISVGIIDTGCGPHTDLNIVSGRNTVLGEAASDFEDWDGHGTHVAGLVGSHGTPPLGLRGVAPGVDLHAYRVFGNGADGASNYAIMKAMIAAQLDGCDIINMSLGGGPDEPVVRDAVQDARENGMLVVVAAGNDGRSAVSNPAAYPGATAVSAMGHEGTYPVGAYAASAVDRPPNSTVDSDEFMADFTSIGHEISVSGAGVGVLSTLPHNDFGPMGGTSMAAPVVAGAAASLLSRDPGLFAMVRNRARSDAIERMLLTQCTRRGFGPMYEGFGIPDPGLV